MADDTAHVKANGSFAGFDPAVASGKPEMKGTVGGTLDVDATVANVSSGVTPDSVQADAKVDARAVDDRRPRDHARERRRRLPRSTGDIRTLEIVGRDLNVRRAARWRSTRPASRT